MIVGLTSTSSQVSKCIAKRYEFRKNYELTIVGKKDLEYKRKEWDYWMPTSQFANYEGKKIKWLLGLNSGINKFLSFNIMNVIQRTAESMAKQSDVQGKNAKLTKLIRSAPVRIVNVDPLPIGDRTDVEASVGEVCYVCLGVDKKKPRHFTALPAFIESILYEGDQKLYNLLVVKANVQTGKIIYHGRHLVFANEIGLSGTEAVENLAFSQIIY